MLASGRAMVSATLAVCAKLACSPVAGFRLVSATASLVTVWVTVGATAEAAAGG